MATSKEPAAKPLPKKIPKAEVYWVIQGLPRTESGRLVATVAPYMKAPYVVRLLNEHYPGWYAVFDVLGENCVRCTMHLPTGVAYQGIGYAQRDSDKEPLKAAETDALKRASRYIFPHLLELWDEDGYFTAEVRPWAAKRSDGSPKGYDIVSEPQHHQSRNWRPSEDDGEGEGPPEPEPQVQSPAKAAGPRATGNGQADKKAARIAAFREHPAWPAAWPEVKQAVHTVTGNKVTTTRDLFALTDDDLDKLEAWLMAQEGEAPSAKAPALDRDIAAKEIRGLRKLTGLDRPGDWGEWLKERYNVSALRDTTDDQLVDCLDTLREQAGKKADTQQGMEM